MAGAGARQLKFAIFDNPPVQPKQQGVSSVTVKKSGDIFGIIKTRLIMNQGLHIKYGLEEMYIYDVFSGNGVNTHGGMEIPGSPKRILQAINESDLVHKIKRMGVVFSDIRDDAVKELKARVEGIDYPRDIVSLNIIKSDAGKMISSFNRFLIERKKCGVKVHSILLIDPNGPKPLPMDEIRDFSRCHAKTSDLIINFDTAAFSRVRGHYQTHQKSYDWWIKDVANIKEFVDCSARYYKGGWMRQKMTGVRGWTILACFGYSETRGVWKNQGFLTIDEGLGTWMKTK